MELSELVSVFLRDPIHPPGTAVMTLVLAMSFLGIGLYLMRVSLIGPSGSQGGIKIHDRAALLGGATHFFGGYFLIGWSLSEAAPTVTAAFDAYRWFPGHVLGILCWWRFVMHFTPPLSSSSASGIGRVARQLFDLHRSRYFFTLALAIAIYISVAQVFPDSWFAQYLRIYPEDVSLPYSGMLQRPGSFYWVESVYIAALLIIPFVQLLAMWWAQRHESALRTVDRTVPFLLAGAFSLMVGSIYFTSVILFQPDLPYAPAVVLMLAGVFFTGHGTHVNHGIRIGGVYTRRFLWPMVLGPLTMVALALLLFAIGEADLSYNAFAVFLLLLMAMAVWGFTSEQIRRSFLGARSGQREVAVPVDPAGTDDPGGEDAAGSGIQSGARTAAADRPGRDILSQSPRVIGMELVKPVLRHFRNHEIIRADAGILLSLELVSLQRQEGESPIDTLRRILSGLVEIEKPLPFPKQPGKVLSVLSIEEESGQMQRYVSLKYWWLMHVPQNANQRAQAREDMYVDYYRALENGDRFTVEIVDRLIELNASGARGRAVLRKWRDAGCVEIARRLQRREAEARRMSISKGEPDSL